MPARDPFFNTRAAEIAANIMGAELSTFVPSVFTDLTPTPVGEVLATTRRGTVLTLAWDVDHQCIRTVMQDGYKVENGEVRLCA